MKNSILIAFLVVLNSAFSQNEQVNTDSNVLGNQSPQAYANNTNLPDAPNQQINFIMNTNKIQQVPVPQQQVSVQPQHSQGVIMVNVNHINTGYSGISIHTSKTKTHEHKLDLDLKFFYKIFDKKFKKIHHYKKKGRIKMCATFK